MATNKKSEEKNADLGLGERVAQENRTRFLNSDGTFNVRRKGMFEHGSFSLYHAVLSMNWPVFFVWLVSTYLSANIIFTVLYILCGRGAFVEIANANLIDRIGDIFFFSIHAITTVGESGIQPTSAIAKAISSVEAMAGLIGLAVAAGVIFARFSNPAVKIIFSKHGIIAPYENETAFMVRLANGRSNELVDLKATLTLSLLGKDGKRHFEQLDLERDTIAVFPLSWTIVHPITKDSPLYGIGAEEFARRSPEFLLSISAIDQDLAKTVYARRSYIASEIDFGTRFKNIFERTNDGTIVIDPKRVHEIEKV